MPGDHRSRWPSSARPQTSLQPRQRGFVCKCPRVATTAAFVHTIPDGVLQCHTVVEGLDWLPEDGVVLTRADLERTFMNLRALIAGTGQVDPNRSFAVDIAVAITHAIETESGGE